MAEILESSVNGVSLIDRLAQRLLTFRFSLIQSGILAD